MLSTCKTNAAKRINRSLGLFILSLLLVVSFMITTPTQAASNVSLNSEYNRVLVWQSSSKYMKAVAKKLGLKQGKNRNYKTYFASGKNLWMGMNTNAGYPKNYVCIKNTGNKNLAVLGVKVGMTKAKAIAQLKKYYHYYDKTGNTYSTTCSSMYLRIQNGKVTGYTYKFFPTS